jgi:glycosyltransferase involved in cell wall biosynthesis
VSVVKTQQEQELTHPTVAVIVTCYNQERYIRQALDSLVHQSKRPTEIVVIDGFSHDRSVAVIGEWISENDVPITFIAHDRNYGLCATLNQAMSLITSDFVVTLYGDDWLELHRLETQSSLLSQAPTDVCMVVSSMREVDRRGVPVLTHDFRDRVHPLTLLAPAERVETLVAENKIPSPAVMLRANRVREVGGYDESLTFDDYDMWMRLLSKYTLIYDPSIVVNYRVLQQSLSRNTARHGDFLLSEAKMIFKHVGLTATINQTIRDRLIVSGQKRRVLLKMLRSVDPTWQIRRGAFAALLPQGAKTIHKMRLLETNEH